MAVPENNYQLTPEQIEDVRAHVQSDIEDPAVRRNIITAITAPGAAATRANTIMAALAQLNTYIDSILTTAGVMGGPLEDTYRRRYYLEVRDRVLYSAIKDVTDSLQNDINEGVKLNRDLQPANNKINHLRRDHSRFYRTLGGRGVTGLPDPSGTNWTDAHLSLATSEAYRLADQEQRIESLNKDLTKNVDSINQVQADIATNTNDLTTTRAELTRLNGQRTSLSADHLRFATTLSSRFNITPPVNPNTWIDNPNRLTEAIDLLNAKLPTIPDWDKNMVTEAQTLIAQLRSSHASTLTVNTNREVQQNKETSLITKETTLNARLTALRNQHLRFETTLTNPPLSIATGLPHLVAGRYWDNAELSTVISAVTNSLNNSKGAKSLYEEIKKNADEFISTYNDRGTKNDDYENLVRRLLGLPAGAAIPATGATDIQEHGQNILTNLKRRLSSLPRPDEFVIDPGMGGTFTLRIGTTNIDRHTHPNEFNAFIAQVLMKPVASRTALEIGYLASIGQEINTDLSCTDGAGSGPADSNWIARVRGIPGASNAGIDLASLANNQQRRDVAEALAEHIFATAVVGTTYSLGIGGVVPLPHGMNFVVPAAGTPVAYPSLTNLQLYAISKGVNSDPMSADFRSAIVGQLTRDILGPASAAIETQDPNESKKQLLAQEADYAKLRARYATRRFFQIERLKGLFGEWIGAGGYNAAEVRQARERVRDARLLHARNSINATHLAEGRDVVNNLQHRNALIKDVINFTLESRDRVIDKEQTERKNWVTWHERIENLINRHPLISIGTGLGIAGVGILGAAVASPAIAPAIAIASAVGVGVIKWKLGSRASQSILNKILFWQRKVDAREYHGAPDGEGYDIDNDTASSSRRKLGQAIAVFSTQEHQRRYKEGHQWFKDITMWRQEEAEKAGKTEGELFDVVLFQEQMRQHLNAYIEHPAVPLPLGTASNVDFPVTGTPEEQRAAMINEAISWAIARREHDIDERVETHKNQLRRVAAISDILSGATAGSVGVFNKGLIEDAGNGLASGGKSMWAWATDWWSSDSAAEKAANLDYPGSETPGGKDIVGNAIGSTKQSVAEAIGSATEAANQSFTFELPDAQAGEELQSLSEFLKEKLNYTAEQVKELEAKYSGVISDASKEAGKLELPSKMIEDMANMKGDAKVVIEQSLADLSKS